MATITFDENNLNSFDHAARKMFRTYVPAKNDVSREALVKMTIVGGKHTEAFQGVHWGPNWQQIDGRENFPTGFQFTVNRNSQVLPIFSANQMFGVQMAFPLDAGANTMKTSRGKEIDGTYFTNNAQNIANLWNEKIDGDALSATSNTNFIGIYASERRSNTGYEKRHYAVVRYSDPKVSEEIAEKIKDAKTIDEEKSVEYILKLSQKNFNDDPSYVGNVAPHKTWQQLFVEDEQMISLRAKQTAACGTMLLHTLYYAGLGTVAHGDKLKIDNLSALLKSPQLITSTFNDVDHINGTNNLVYLSEMCSVNSATNGFIFRHKPELGITLYGPSSYVASPDFIGLPSGIGMLRSVNAHNMHETLEDAEKLRIRAPFTWDAKKGQFNTLLSQTIYKPHDTEEWCAIEKKLGLSAEKRTVDYLKPVVVKLSATAQPPKKK